MKLILTLFLITSSLFSEQIKIFRDGIVPSLFKDGKQFVKVYLNHENSSQNEIMLSGLSPSFSIDIPVANRWEVIGARAVIRYTPSIALEEDRSFLSIKLRNYTLKQFPLLEQKFVDSGELLLDIPLPYNKMEQHNLFTIQLYQHYSKSGVEDMTKAPEVWTQINLEESFVELEIKHREIPKDLSSLIGNVFDIYNPIEQNINYVFSDTSDETIYNYAFFSSVLGKILQYRKVDFSITDKQIVYDRDNLIIATTDQLKDIFDKNGFGFQIRGNVNIFKNPKDKRLAIIIITAKTEDKLKEVLFSTFGLDLNLNSGNSKIVKKVIYPDPAPPYSSPDFISAGQKVFFKDLGYKTSTFEGFFAPTLNLEFKLYPDLNFKNKEKGEVFVDYIFPFAVQDESVSNIFVNNVFVSQVKMLEERDTQTLKSYLMLDSRTPNRYPAALLKGGKNSFAVHFKMIPLNWNPASLKTTVLDSSYFEIPEADHWIGMANLEDFTSSAYPFSIYPDLQDTHFLLTDINVSTIETVMQVARFLGESVKYPPYYLSVGRELNSDVESKNIIMIGSYNEQFDDIYKSAPLILAKQGYIRDIDLSNKFTEDLEDLEEREVPETSNQRERFIRLFETTENSQYLITQFFQSPYDGDKTILMFSGQDISLKDEVKQILDPKFREKIKGDLVISKLTTNTDRELFNFDILDPYFIGNISQISRIYNYIGEHPLLFVIISVILIILAVYLLRKTLLLYRTRYHESDASAID
jgi:hypothetical protein